MQSWAQHTGKLDPDGNILESDDEGDVTKDKYWQKYMTDSSPYRIKSSSPTKHKSPERERPQSGNGFPKRFGRKKKPKWMTNEQYERLMTKSHVKRNTEKSDNANTDQEFFENGGEILRWPEVLQKRAFSPSRRPVSKPGSPEPDEHHEDLYGQNLAGTDRMKGTYRPKSAPLGKTPTKNLFQKQGPTGFFSDLLVAPVASTPAGRPADDNREDSEAKPKRARSASRGRQAKQRSSRRVSPTPRSRPSSPNRYDDIDPGIVEYGDGDDYVIEDEEAAIHRIQTAMISAVAKGGSPKGRRLNRDEDDDYKKIGDDLFVSGMKTSLFSFHPSLFGVNHRSKFMKHSIYFISNVIIVAFLQMPTRQNTPIRSIPHCYSSIITRVTRCSGDQAGILSTILLPPTLGRLPWEAAITCGTSKRQC